MSAPDGQQALEASYALPTPSHLSKPPGNQRLRGRHLAWRLLFFTVKRRQKPNTLNPLHSKKAQEQEGILEAHSFLGLGSFPRLLWGQNPSFCGAYSFRPRNRSWSDVSTRQSVLLRTAPSAAPPVAAEGPGSEAASKGATCIGPGDWSSGARGSPVRAEPVGHRGPFGSMERRTPRPEYSKRRCFENSS